MTDNGNKTYPSKIIKAGALLADTKTLLAYWDESASVAENLKRAQEENIFAKNSRSWIKQFLAIFRQRYLTDTATARALKGKEAEEILKAANLSALSQVFYGGPQGLNLVVKGEGDQYAPHPEAGVAKEVLDYLVREHSYGNRETRTGKAIETRFGGLGYGWDRDLLRLILAVLLRAGSIEVSHQGQRFDSYQDPRSRPPFINNVAFKAALFTPTTPIDLKTLTKAVRGYENLTGQTVDVEKNAIAAVFKEWAEAQLAALIPVQAEVRAYQLPVMAQLAEYQTNLNSVQTGAADDCVRILAGEGASLKESQERLRQIGEVVNAEGVAAIRQARVAAKQMWPLLRKGLAIGDWRLVLSVAEGLEINQVLAEAAENLAQMLKSKEFYLAMAEIKARTAEIAAAYREIYSDLHGRRAQIYDTAIETIKGHPDWAGVPPEMQSPILSSLATRACPDLALPAGVTTCQNCDAGLNQLESDLAAANGLKTQALARIEEIVKPPVPTEKVQLADFFPASPDSHEAIDEALENLRDHLAKLLDEGVKIVLQ